MALVLVVVLASVLVVRPPAAASTPASAPTSARSVTPPSASAAGSINYTYSDFFNVPWGEWWDMRTALYGDEPVGASCFNQTAVADGTCTTNVAGLPRVAKFPYEDWLPPAGTAAIYAPYRVKVTGSAVSGYNLSQPVFLPVTNYAAAPGSSLSFTWDTQYLDKANTTLVTTTRGCYGGTGATANEGYQLWSHIYLTMDNQEAARLFGATVSATPSTIQNWWNTNTLPGCSGSKAQSGALETSLNSWFQNTANGKYAIYNGYAGSYISLYTNVTATVLSGGATGTTRVYIEHGAWGTEALLDRWFYWGNATYAGNQADSSKAAGWWGMENGWWEGVHYTGTLGAATMNFQLGGVLQYHFQEHATPGPDGVYRSTLNPSDADDVPVWTWGPALLDYVAAKAPSTPYSELSRYSGLNYVKTTPGSTDYGTNTSFDYTPISWVAKTGESWWFTFPTTAAAYYQNPATATLGTTLPATQLPSITSTLSYLKIFPATYGTWTAAAGTWLVTGGTSESWPPGTPTGGYPYLPYPGIYFAPGSLPPSVTTTAASGITTTAATLNGNLGSKGSASTVTVGFLWGTSPTLAGATNVTVNANAAVGAFSTALSGLSSSTTYYVRAWANGAGFATGSILSFTTATPASPPTVTTVAASGITTTAATVNGNLGNLGSATTVTVGFLWGTSATLVGATNVTVGPMTATGAFSSGLGGLTAGTTYYFEAWGNGAAFGHGSILSFTTATAGAAPSVSTSAATGITTTAATLNGNLASKGSAATVSVGFLWGTSATLAGATNVTVNANAAVGAFSSTLATLAPGTTYYFEAWANGQGFANGAVMSFTTASTPPTVATVAASGVTTTAATLNGNLASLGTATTVTEGFLWGTSATLVGATNVTVGSVTATGAFSSGLTGLTPGTPYYFEAWANGQGFANGAILSFTTGTTPPTVVTDPAGGITTTTSILYGHTTSLGTATAVRVGFYWGTSATLVGATNDSITTQTATAGFIDNVVGLTPGTTYYFQAWASGHGFVTGSILSFVTPTAPPVVQTSAASGLSPTGATLNGATTSLGTASSVSVGFLWGTSPTLATSTNVSVATQTAPATFSSSLTGLTPGTTYYFQAWANGQGFSVGSILSFTAAITPVSVSTVAASSITRTGATLNGNIATLGSAANATVGFLWGTSATLAGATNVTVGDQTVAGPFSHALVGLTPSTTYYFEAWAHNATLGFARGSIANFTTLAPLVAPTVTTGTASGISTTAATLNGNLASLGSAVTVTEGFLWGTAANLAGATNVTVGSVTATGAFSDPLTGLTPGTTYYFQAWARGDAFASGAITSFATSTTSVSPPIVSTTAATSVTSANATLNGDLAALGSAASVTVGFLWGTSLTLAGATNVTVGTRSATGNFVATLTGLTPGTTYYFAAWALGSGFVRGTILSFTTPSAAAPPSEPSSLMTYAIVAIIVIVVVALLVVLLMRRRKKSPPKASEAPPPPPPGNP